MTITLKAALVASFMVGSIILSGCSSSMTPEGKAAWDKVNQKIVGDLIHWELKNQGIQAEPVKHSYTAEELELAAKYELARFKKHGDAYDKNMKVDPFADAKDLRTKQHLAGWYKQSWKKIVVQGWEQVIMRLDQKEMKSWLDLDADPGQALAIAIFNKNRAISDWIMDNYGPIERKKNKRIVMALLLTRDVAWLKWAIEKGMDVKDKEAEALFYAMVTSTKDVVKFLVTEGVAINVERKEDTPLIMAVRIGDMELVQFFLEHGGDVNQATSFGKKPLDVANLHKHKDVRQLLLTKGATPSSTNQKPKHYENFKFGQSLDLTKVMQNKHFGILQYALANGLDANKQVEGGDSLLIKAVERGDPEMALLLIQAGANVNYVNEAFQFGTQSIVSPLATAVGNNDVKMVIALLNHDANPNTPLVVKQDVYTGYDGKMNKVKLPGRPTVLALAMQKKNKRLIQILQSKGAKPYL